MSTIVFKLNKELLNPIPSNDVDVDTGITPLCNPVSLFYNQSRKLGLQSKSSNESRYEIIQTYTFRTNLPHLNWDLGVLKFIV